MIVPDTKDWTWVLDQTCPDCGFDAGSCRFDEVPDLVRADAAAWGRLIAEGQIVAGRPNDSTWSSLEYACHVRDVFRRYHQRIELMLTRDDPLFPNWDQDTSATEDRYDEQEPAQVGAELAAAAKAIADQLEGVDAEQRARAGRRGDGAKFTISTIARYMIHDPVHHLWDVTGTRA